MTLLITYFAIGIFLASLAYIFERKFDNENKLSLIDLCLIAIFWPSVFILALMMTTEDVKDFKRSVKKQLDEEMKDEVEGEDSDGR